MALSCLDKKLDRLDTLNKEIKKLKWREEEIEVLEKSFSYRIGRAITYIPRKIIETVEEENAPAILDEFEQVKALSKCHVGQYAFVKTWFLKRYKDVVSNEEDEGDVEIDVQ